MQDIALMKMFSAILSKVPGQGRDTLTKLMNFDGLFLYNSGFIILKYTTKKRPPYGKPLYKFNSLFL